MLFEVREKAYGCRCTFRQIRVTEIAPLVSAEPEVTPLGKYDRLALCGSHVERVALDDIRSENIACGTEPDRRVWLRQGHRSEESPESTQEVFSTLGRIIGKQLDAVDAHEREECIVTTLEVAAAVTTLHCCELSLENRDQKIPRTTGWLKKPRVNSFRLRSDEIEHVLNQPARSEHLAVVGNALPRFDESLFNRAIFTHDLQGTRTR